jgi:hypothetical protein
VRPKTFFIEGNKHVDVYRNTEDQSDTEIKLPVPPIPIEGLSRRERARKERGRYFIGLVATALLLRRLRQDLGLVYSISCYYQSRAHDPSMCVSFTSRPTDARVCRAEVMGVLRKMAEGGIEREDYKAVLEQHHRDLEEDEFTNAHYENIVCDAIGRVRAWECDAGGDEGTAKRRVLMRADGVEEDQLGKEVAYQAWEPEDPELVDIVAEAKVVMGGERCLSVSLLPTKREPGELRRRALFRGAAVVVGMAFASVM